MSLGASATGIRAWKATVVLALGVAMLFMAAFNVSPADAGAKKKTKVSLKITTKNQA